MITQVTAMAGDILSPIRLAFQHIPYKPRCWAAEEVDVELSSADLVVNIDGYNARRNDVEQMNNKITIINDGKSNKALIFSSRQTTTTKLSQLPRTDNFRGQLLLSFYFRPFSFVRKW